MAGNIEFALITRVIQDKDFHSLEKLRIDEDYFASPEAREVYRFLRQTFHAEATSGQVPSFELVQARFPSFFFATAYDTVEVLAQEVRREKARMELLKLSNNLQLLAEKDPLAAIAELRAESSKMAAITDTSADLSMSGAFNILLDRYEAVAASGGILGIPYPWAPLNEETQGMQPGQFIVFYGRPKSMKSWVVINCAVHAYLNARRRVLIYTKEMSLLEVAQRTAATIAKVDYKSFKNGRLQPEVKARVFTILKELIEDEKAVGSMGNHQPFLIISSDRGAAEGGGISFLQSKIRDLKPDLVIVDGMYLMKDDRSKQRSVDWRQIAHVSQDMKLTAAQYNVPIIGVTQANRNAEKTKGDDLTELAFSDALGQDADAVFRVIKKDNPETKLTELILTAPGLREGKFDGIVIHGQPGVNFGYIKAYVHQDDDDPTPSGGGGGRKGEYGAPRSAVQNGQQFRRPEVRDPVVK